MAEDREAVDRFLSSNRLPPEVRLPELAAPELPPVELAPLEELQTAAAAAPTLQRLRALVDGARVHKGRLVPVRQHRRLLDDPLELCSRAALVLPSLDSALPLTSMIESSFPDGLAEVLVDLLWLL